jgi:3-oxoacyl-[acyl-carrier-protein] synthase-3
MDLRYGSIVGWGLYAPDNVVTNDDLAEVMDTSDEWIRSRSGIRERRFVEKDECTSTMCIASAEKALATANLDASDLDLIIIATSSPDYLTPPVSSQVQEALGASCGAMQVTVGCTGFVYGLVTAQQFIATGACDTILVVGAELISRWINFEDRSTAVLFGDGAGAVILQATDEPCGLLSHVLGSDGSGYEHIIVPAGGMAEPPTSENVAAGRTSIHMNGREVFKFATRVMGTALQEALDGADLTADDIDLLIPHQANARIIEYAAAQFDLPMEKVVVNVDRYGNTSAASVPLALCEALDDGRIQPGDTLALVAFGAGLTWGAAIFQLGTQIPAFTRTAEATPAAEPISA